MLKFRGTNYYYDPRGCTCTREFRNTRNTRMRTQMRGAIFFDQGSCRSGRLRRYNLFWSIARCTTSTTNVTFYASSSLPSPPLPVLSLVIPAPVMTLPYAIKSLCKSESLLVRQRRFESISTHCFSTTPYSWLTFWVNGMVPPQAFGDDWRFDTEVGKDLVSETDIRMGFLY